MRRLTPVVGLMVLTSLTVAACSDESAPPPLPESGIPSASRPAMPAGGGMGTGMPTGALPAGHPPIGGAQDPHVGLDMTGGGMPAPRAPVPEAAMPVKWTVPAAWEETPPSSSMRLANYTVGKSADGAPVECIVFAGIGGSDQENLDRWTGFFKQADGSSSKDKAQVTTQTRDGIAVTRMHVSGQFSGDTGMGGGGGGGEWTMLSGIVRNKALDEARGRIFIKLQGPSDIVKAAAADFDAFLASMQARGN